MLYTSYSKPLSILPLTNDGALNPKRLWTAASMELLSGQIMFERQRPCSNFLPHTRAPGEAIDRLALPTMGEGGTDLRPGLSRETFFIDRSIALSWTTWWQVTENDEHLSSHEKNRVRNLRSDSSQFLNPSNSSSLNSSDSSPPSPTSIHFSRFHSFSRLSPELTIGRYSTVIAKYLYVSA